MLTEPLPIDIFISSRFIEKDVIALVDNWRIEKEELQKILGNYFKELGIVSVTPDMERRVKQTMISWLQSAPEIYQMVKKAEYQDLVRRQARKS